MKLKLRKKLLTKTGKVKSVDFHPSFSWILLGLYDGTLSIYDYNTQTSIQYLEVSVFPIRTAKFMPTKNYIICGSDDKMIRVFNYNTMEKIKEIEAHTDFIRSIIIHKTSPLFVSSSDDGTIKLYTAEKNFDLIRTYDEHKDFVMCLATNPKDYSMFASACMDKSVKIWSFNSSNSQLTLEGHEKGVNSVAFCPLNDKPYLASGGDDYAIKIWDYTNKNCIFTFTGHEGNISALCFHLEMPILISAGEDQTCKFWNVNTGKIEDSKIFGYDVVWSITANEQNLVGIGCDEATIVFQMGSDMPMVTFSSGQAKIIYSMQNNIYSINLKQIQHESKNGEIINILPKSLGSSDIYPSGISYSPSGRYFAILADNEFIISTSGVYRSSCVGNCGGAFSWNDGDNFLTKMGSTIKIFSDLKEKTKFSPGYSFDEIFARGGGDLFAVRGEDAVYFYDIENLIFIRKIDVYPKKIFWNEKKNLVALVCDDGTFILKVNREEIDKYIEDISEGNIKADDNGLESSFDMFYDINDKILTGFFLDDIFIFQDEKNRISYTINEKVFPITSLSDKYYLLGYLNSTNRFYLMNKRFELISYSFPMSFINYQIEILNKNYEKAEEVYKSIPEDLNEKVVAFLEKFNQSEISYKKTKNFNQKFSLALKLKKLSEATEMAKKENSSEKLKMVADLALEQGEFILAENAMTEANDFSGLLLFYSCIQDKNKILSLAEKTKNEGVHNIAFSCYYQLNDLENCLDILLSTKKYPEAALFCRTYFPSKVSDVLELWNKQLDDDNDNERVVMKIVNPVNEENAENLEIGENLNMEFYKKVSEGNVDNIDKYTSFLHFDAFSKIVKGQKEFIIDELLDLE